jgi:PAS domain S-box-containing protein
MVAIYFIYGLAFFCLGLAVTLEARRTSELPLSRQLPWLAAFGIIHALVEWADMFLLVGPPEPYYTELLFFRTIFLPISAILLIRFGAGLIGDAGPLPKWVWFLPLVLTMPAAFLIALALIATTVEPFIAIDVWSRYLLYFTGCLLAGIGFLRQRQAIKAAHVQAGQGLMLAAALIFFFNAFVAGLVVPASPYGLAPWLNYDTVFAATGIPVQFWRMLSAVTLTIFVIRALDVFEAERRHELEQLERQRETAEKTLRDSEERFRAFFDFAPIGIVIEDIGGRPFQTNYALQRMMGYTAAEMQNMTYKDYTHPADLGAGTQQVQELVDGQQDHFRLQKRYLHKDGSLIWGNVTVSSVHDPSSDHFYFIAMVEDITARKHAEQELEIKRQQIQEARLAVEKEGRETAEKWFQALVDISERISAMEDIDEVLLHIVEQTQTLITCDMVTFGLMDDSGAHLQIAYQAVGDRKIALDPPLTIENEILFTMLQSGHAYRFPLDVEASSAEWYCPTVAQKIQAAAVVPLCFDDQLIGGMWIGRFGPDEFSLTDLIGLKSLADQAVIALQHSLMAARLQSLAVLEERSRIAREMHDGLSQVLGYLSLQVQTLDALLQQGETEKMFAELQRTRENIKTAQADVRENILSLRTTLGANSGVVDALQEYVTEFGLQTGKKTELDAQVDGSLNLSPMAEVQMVRIVQEALSNVRKHAQAEHVIVRLALANGCLKLTITDDGVGFEMAPDRRRFGLQTMQERAQNVGGDLAIHSTINEGTQVALRLPLIASEPG